MKAFYRETPTEEQQYYINKALDMIRKEYEREPTLEEVKYIIKIFTLEKIELF